MSFADLGLSDSLLRAVTDSGYDVPTPIQKGAIPPVLMGKDLIGIAQTGTGKTASFVLPMIDILSEGRSRARMPRSLILEPTRELAAQVAENFEKYGKYHKLSMALLIGGVQMGDQVKALEKGVDVLIATPGRLMDLFGRGKIMLNGCDLLVIDEADRMLDMGFIPDIEEICSKLPKSRQTLLFSATMPPPIQKLAAKFLTDPKTVEVARPATANVNIDQRLVTVPNAAKKRDALRHILREEGFKNAIVFSNKKVTVRDLYTSLKRSGFSVGQIQGDMDQGSRIAEFDRFKKDEITILVASDVAARGLGRQGRQPRHQLRRAVAARRLHPPHRPHRPRGHEGHRLHARDPRRCRGDCRDREIDRVQDQPRRQRGRKRRAVGRSRAGGRGSGACGA
jgi:superfamily II DNA/RNA helicase